MTVSKLTTQAEAKLPGLAIGESATFELPTEQPARQVAYLAVQTVAQIHFGIRNFSIRTNENGSITVTRTLRQPYPAGRRQLVASMRKAAE